MLVPVVCFQWKINNWAFGILDILLAPYKTIEILFSGDIVANCPRFFTDCGRLWSVRNNKNRKCHQIVIFKGKGLEHTIRSMKTF